MAAYGIDIDVKSEKYTIEAGGLLKDVATKSRILGAMLGLLA